MKSFTLRIYVGCSTFVLCLLWFDITYNYQFPPPPLVALSEMEKYKRMQQCQLSVFSGGICINHCLLVWMEVSYELNPDINKVEWGMGCLFDNQCYFYHVQRCYNEWNSYITTFMVWTRDSASRHILFRPNIYHHDTLVSCISFVWSCIPVSTLHFHM